MGNFVNGKHIAAIAGPGVVLTGCNRVRVTDNIAGNILGPFALLIDCSDCVVRDNTMQDVAQASTATAAVQLLQSTGTPRRNVVSENKAYQSNATYGQTFLAEGAGVDWTSATDNTLSGFSTPYSASGSYSNLGGATLGSAAWNDGVLSIGSDMRSILVSGMYVGTSGGPVIETIRMRGIASAPTIVNAGDVVQTVLSYGYDGAANQVAARVDVRVDGTPAAGSMPGRYVISTTPSGTGTPIERLRCDSAGNVIVGIGLGVLDAAATAGFLYVPRINGRPTGVPAVYGSAIPLVYDVADNKLYAFNGVWRAATFS